MEDLHQYLLCLVCRAQDSPVSHPQTHRPFKSRTKMAMPPKRQRRDTDWAEASRSTRSFAQSRRQAHTHHGEARATAACRNAHPASRESLSSRHVHPRPTRRTVLPQVLTTPLRRRVLALQEARARSQISPSRVRVPRCRVIRPWVRSLSEIYHITWTEAKHHLHQDIVTNRRARTCACLLRIRRQGT